MTLNQPQGLFERNEEKDIFRYFAPDEAPGSRLDTTLAAFAQLVALRLNTTRALISLINHTSQYILVEATQNSPLVSDQAETTTDVGDGLLFGRTTFPRSLGLCGDAIESLPASPRESPISLQEASWRPSPLVINDVLHSEQFSQRPFAMSHPSVRFFAAMPISTTSGVSVGAVSVMDEKPRLGLSQVEVEFLRDISVAIMAHLEMARCNEGHKRSEKMIKGLGVFMEGRTNLDEWWLELGGNKNKTQRQQTSTRVLSPAPPDSPVPPPKDVLEYESPPEGGKGSQHQDEPETPRPSLSPRHTNSRTFTTDIRKSHISARLKEMFSRAGHIIQESIEVDGALFLDAHMSSLSERTESRVSSDATSSGVDVAGTDRGSETNVNSNLEAAKCGILGFRTGANSSMHGDKASNLVPITEACLHGLLQKYPHGHVFSAIDLESSGGSKRRGRERGREREQVRERHILDMLPGAHSIAFIPLWDSHSERWFSAGFMWTVNQTKRVLTRAGDLNYLVAFGNSIMAEVARLDVVGADRVKSDFISSISHELRSPLHGILASVELLQETTVDPFQYSMIDTIERCGRTLLDTIQHVLDFAKINTFTKSRTGKHRHPHPSTTTGRPPLARAPHLKAPANTDIDLSLLAEDVVDCVFAGHVFQVKSSSRAPEFGRGDGGGGFSRRNSVIGMDREGYYSTTTHKGVSTLMPGKNHMDVIFDIGYRPNWMFNTQSGALQRILMNLFGNALKYTSSGWIKVSLHASDVVTEEKHPTAARSAASAANTSSSEPTAQSQSSVITIGVSDTGCGMTQDYLQGGLFTPFTQEDPMNPGTGLGLSIVLQIVRSLKGTIKITSEKGMGTEVVVTLTLRQAVGNGGRQGSSAGTSEGEVVDEDVVETAKRKSTGLVVSLAGFDHTGPDILVLPFRTSIEKMMTNWFGMRVAAMAREDEKADIYLTNEPPPKLLEPEDPKQKSTSPAPVRAPNIILCSHEALYREYTRRKSRGVLSSGHGPDELVHFVSKPCGPRKLAKALVICLYHDQNTHGDDSARTSLDPQMLAPAQQSIFGGFASGSNIVSLDGNPSSTSTTSPIFWVRKHAREDYFPPPPSPGTEKPLDVTGMNKPSSGVASSSKGTTSASMSAAGSESGSGRRKPLLLLVEDNEVNLRLLSTFVRKGNYEFETAENGLEALQAFQSGQKAYDIVFMDISMPVMDGMVATREIRKLEHTRRVQKPTLIIALTGLSSATSREEAFSSGVNLFLTKPVRLKDIRKILDNWVGE